MLQVSSSYEDQDLTDKGQTNKFYQISVDRVSRRIAKLQDQKHNTQRKILQKIFEAADYQYKDTGNVHQFTKTYCLVAPIKEIFSQFILPVTSFFRFVDKGVMGSTLESFLLVGNANQVSNFFSQHIIKISKQYKFIMYFSLTYGGNINH